MRMDQIKASFLVFSLSILLGYSTQASPSFIQVTGTHFTNDGARYTYMGANFWEGMNLGSLGAGGDRPRLLKELDQLKSLGVTNLRILAGSEGPNTEPARIVPALQTSPGVYDPKLLGGLDFLLSEMKKRDLHAVMILNNFWTWSGGMAQYRQWAEGGAIPYPQPTGKASWDEYMAYAAGFYSSPKAMGMFSNFLRMIIKRKNTITKKYYYNDPTIMTWELGNEPRGMDNKVEFNKWISTTADFIKSLDKNHLVTTGCEGNLPDAGLDFVKNHSDKNIDYATEHIWVQNWGWYDPMKATKTFDSAVKKMKDFYGDHVKLALKLGKPVVLEEFGLARDDGSYDPASPTTYKDKYYSEVFDLVYNSAVNGDFVAGVNFWAWSGDGHPADVHGSSWKPGDTFLGDPPHEPQGWYSVYSTDTTVKAISDYALKFMGLK